MFKFLSLFKRNRDEQINDNDYDSNEVPAPGIDVGGEVSAQNSTVIDNALGAAQQPKDEPRNILQAHADRASTDASTAATTDMSGNPQPPSGKEDFTTTSEDEETPNNILFSPDVNLIPEQGHPGEETGEERPEIPIGVTHFQKGDKSLDWVAVEHTGDLQDPVHLTIAEAITTRNPQIVITEGHATYRGPDTSNSILDNRQEIIDGTKEQVEKVKSNNDVQDPDTNIPEAGYAAYIAQEHGIPSIGGEPTGKELLDGMKARVNRMEPQGYLPEAVVADAFMRQVERMKLAERKAMTEEEFMKNHASELLAEANRRVDPLQVTNTPPLTLDQFKEWYAAHPLSGNRRYIDVDYGDFTPRQDGSYSQVMACESGVMRDQYLAELIADLHNQGFDRIMGEYGVDHLPSLRPVLEDEGMYGSPGTFTSLENEDTSLQQAA